MHHTVGSEQETSEGATLYQSFVSPFLWQ